MMSLFLYSKRAMGGAGAEGAISSGGKKGMFFTTTVATPGCTNEVFDPEPTLLPAADRRIWFGPNAPASDVRSLVTSQG